MSQNANIQTLCAAHEIKISAACFYKGCAQALLCRRCYKDHSPDHDSEIQEITDMIDDNSWIEAVEKQKDLELAQIESFHQQKKEIRTENEKLLNEFVQSIIANLEVQKQLWLTEFDKLIRFSDQQEKELDGSLKLLTNLDFAGDILERINKTKIFQDNVLPNAKQLIETFQTHLGTWKVDKEKLEGLKIELTGIIQNVSLKHFLVHEPRIRISEEQIALEQEYQEFKSNTSAKIESLDKKIEDLINENARLQNQLNEMTEAKTHLEDDYQKEVATLKNQIAELDGLKKLGVFGDSKIIKATDFTKLKEWIPKPLSSNEIVLRLIYRTSRDGWDSENFHSKCDDITPTISVIKSKDYERIFGGFTTKSWGLNSGSVEDKDAFIFSLTHGEKYACQDPSRAILTHSNLMVVFGGGSLVSGKDIFIDRNCGTTGCNSTSKFPTSYECSRFSAVTPESQAYLAGAVRFIVEELEVYQVIYL